MRLRLSRGKDDYLILTFFVRILVRVKDSKPNPSSVGRSDQLSDLLSFPVRRAAVTNALCGVV